MKTLFVRYQIIFSLAFLLVILFVSISTLFSVQRIQDQQLFTMKSKAFELKSSLETTEETPFTKASSCREECVELSTRQETMTYLLITTLFDAIKEKFGIDCYNVNKNEPYCTPLINLFSEARNAGVDYESKICYEMATIQGSCYNKKAIEDFQSACISYLNILNNENKSEYVKNHLKEFFEFECNANNQNDKICLAIKQYEKGINNFISEHQLFCSRVNQCFRDNLYDCPLPTNPYIHLPTVSATIIPVLPTDYPPSR